MINAADGVRTEIGLSEGVLVSSSTVAGKEQKARLRKAYGALAVDMEAGAVAQGAQARGIEFATLKAISDDADFELPWRGTVPGRARRFATRWRIILRVRAPAAVNPMLEQPTSRRFRLVGNARRSTNKKVLWRLLDHLHQH